MEQLASSQTTYRGADDDPGDGAGTGAGPDRTTRQAALWATVVAVPMSLLVAFLFFAQLGPDAPDAAKAPAASPLPQSTAPVEMAAPTLAERPEVLCRALLAHLPATVRDLAQRPVSAGAEQNAAYGDPPLTVACGVEPVRVDPLEDVWRVNSVCWHAAERADAMVLTTVDREAPVRVTVPTAYEEALQWAAPISDAVVASVPSIPAADIPAGCTG